MPWLSACDVLQSTVKTGVVLLTIGYKDRNVGIGADVGLWGNGDGFVSVPNEPDAAGCAQVLYLQEGSVKSAVAIRDRRYSEKGGALEAGDRAILSSSAARLFLKNAMATIAMYTENQKDNDSSMILELNGEKGAIRAVDGKAYFTMTKDEILIGVGGTCIKLTEDGFFLYGKHFAANTGGGNLGTIGPIPPPLGSNSLVAGPAGNVAVPSTRWTVSL